MSVNIVSIDDWIDDHGRKVLTKCKTYKYSNHRTNENDSYFVRGNYPWTEWFPSNFFCNVKEHRNKVLKDLLEC
jgi:hypothetical protein